MIHTESISDGEKERRIASVYKLLSDEEWHATIELDNVGGTEGTRRQRELRRRVDKGLYPPFTTIENERIGGGSTQHRYRLSRTVAPKDKTTTKEDIAERLEEAEILLESWRPVVNAAIAERRNFKGYWLISIEVDRLLQQGKPE